MPRKKPLIKAVAYLRQSNSVEGSDSQARQSAACSSIAKKLGFKIEREFFDFAPSQESAFAAEHAGWATTLSKLLKQTPVPATLDEALAPVRRCGGRRHTATAAGRAFLSPLLVLHDKRSIEPRILYRDAQPTRKLAQPSI